MYSRSLYVSSGMQDLGGKDLNMRSTRSSRSRVLIKVFTAVAVLAGLWLAAGAPIYMGF
jgi:hypothetical protein